MHETREGCGRVWTEPAPPDYAFLGSGAGQGWGWGWRQRDPELTPEAARVACVVGRQV